MRLDLPDFTTAMDGGSAAIGKEPMRPTAMDGGRDCSRQSSAFPPSMEVRSAGAAGSGSSKNMEGLPKVRLNTVKLSVVGAGRARDDSATICNHCANIAGAARSYNA